MTEKFEFFYGGPFSNWYACEFTIDGKKYFSTEQHMMAEKARLFNDHESASRIMQTRDPQESKIIGRSIKGFDKAIWEEKARDIVYAGCYAKFKQNYGLLQYLNATAGSLLVEASPTDQIWGVGLGEDDERIKDRSNWVGTNWLGEVLTQVREDLANGIYQTSGFNWSESTVNNDVKIINRSGAEIWIWDNDKMRRAAYDLKEKVEVIVDKKCISISCKGIVRSVPFEGSLLKSFNKALDSIKEQLNENSISKS